MIFVKYNKIKKLIISPSLSLFCNNNCIKFNNNFNFSTSNNNNNNEYKSKIENNLNILTNNYQKIKYQFDNGKTQSVNRIELCKILLDLEKDNNKSFILYKMGTFLNPEKQQEEIINLYNNVLEINPDNIDCKFDLIQCLINNNNNNSINNNNNNELIINNLLKSIINNLKYKEKNNNNFNNLLKSYKLLINQYSNNSNLIEFNHFNQIYLNEIENYKSYLIEQIHLEPKEAINYYYLGNQLDNDSNQVINIGIGYNDILMNKSNLYLKSLELNSNLINVNYELFKLSTNLENKKILLLNEIKNNKLNIDAYYQLSLLLINENNDNDNNLNEIIKLLTWCISLNENHLNAKLKLGELIMEKHVSINSIKIYSPLEGETNEHEINIINDGGFELSKKELIELLKLNKK